MKLAILADVHGNLPAFEAVIDHIAQWQPDLVVIAGDLVNRGPRSPECLQLALDKQRTEGWHIVSGNHEDYITSLAEKNGNQTQAEIDFFQPIHWVRDQLANRVETLKTWPDRLDLDLGESGKMTVAHASIQGKRAGIFPRMDEDEIRAKIDGTVEVFCAGHTHVPMARNVDGTLVVNAGSVGLPFDGDTRAAYAQLDHTAHGWRARIIRLDYDTARADNDYQESGFIDGGGAITRMLLYEFRHARSMMHRWTEQYQDAILAEDISVSQSVAQFMADFEA